MRRVPAIVLVLLAVLPVFRAGAAEYVDAGIRVRHAAHLAALVRDFCIEQDSAGGTIVEAENDGRFRPVRGRPYTFETWFDGASYAVSAERAHCTVDVMLARDDGLLLRFDDVGAALAQLPGFAAGAPERIGDTGPEGSPLEISRVRYAPAGGGTREMTVGYPLSGQDRYFMWVTVTY